MRHIAILPGSYVADCEDVRVGKRTLVFIDRDEAYFVGREAACGGPVGRTAADCCKDQFSGLDRLLAGMQNPVRNSRIPSERFDILCVELIFDQTTRALAEAWQKTFFPFDQGDLATDLSIAHSESELDPTRTATDDHSVFGVF